MKTLFEELLNIDYMSLPEKSRARLKWEGINKSQLIIADNVAEYYFEGNDQDYWNVFEDYPNIAPPFSDFFIEYKLPKYIRADGKVLNPSISGKMGMLFGCEEFSGYSNIRWGISATPFVKLDGEPVKEFPFAGYIFADNNGKPVPPREDGEKEIMFGVLDGSGGPEEWWYYYNFFLGILHPCLLTLSFMHCKNVEKIINDRSDHRGRSNKHAPRVKYYTLNITPMREILKTEGKSETVGLKRAMHICRGHFKSYTGKGLFGKYSGTFWWADHVRGHIENGIVEKDYSVNTPIEVK